MESIFKVMRLIKQNPKKTDKQIAKMLDAKEDFVAKVRQQMKLMELN